jgi:hypothetical protein
MVKWLSDLRIKPQVFKFWSARSRVMSESGQVDLANHESRLAELVRLSLEGKLRAIGGYDDILWKIRVGYAAVLYGTLSIALGKEFVAGVASGPELTQYLGALVIGFTFAAVVIDLGFQAKKLKVVVTRDDLVQLSVRGLLVQNAQQVETLCRISGEMRVEELPEHAQSQYQRMLKSNVKWTLLPLYVVAPLAAIVAIYLAA